MGLTGQATSSLELTHLGPFVLRRSLGYGTCNEGAERDRVCNAVGCRSNRRRGTLGGFGAGFAWVCFLVSCFASNCCLIFSGLYNLEVTCKTQ